MTGSEELNAANIAELRDVLKVLAVDTTAIRGLLDIENRKRDKRIRGNRILTVLALIGLFAGGFYAWRTNHDFHESTAAIQRSRVASCQQYNDQQRRQITAEETEIRVITATATSTSPAKIATFLKTYDRNVVTLHPLRDCSPAGIAKYLNLR